MRRLPGIGPVLQTRLARYGVTTVGDLARLTPDTVQRIAGASAGRVRPRPRPPHRHPRRPATHPHLRRPLRGDVLGPDHQRRALLHLATDLGARLRTTGRTARAIELQVTFADRSSITRSRTLPGPTGHSPALRDALYALHTRFGLQRARVRAVTARAADLREQHATVVQPTFDRIVESARTLEPVLDRANTRFGPGTLVPAALADTGRRRTIRAGGRREMFVDSV